MTAGIRAYPSTKARTDSYGLRYLPAERRCRPRLATDERCGCAQRLRRLKEHVVQWICGYRRTDMNKEEFLRLMSFPMEWESWGLYPNELFEAQLGMYRPGDERGSEHDRNGAFHWWLKRSPSKVVLEKLLLLADKDSDPVMAADIRQHITRALDKN